MTNYMYKRIFSAIPAGVVVTDDLACQYILPQPTKSQYMRVHHNRKNERLLTVEYTLYGGSVTTWHAK